MNASRANKQLTKKVLISLFTLSLFSSGYGMMTPMAYAADASAVQTVSSIDKEKNPEAYLAYLKKQVAKAKAELGEIDTALPDEKEEASAPADNAPSATLSQDAKEAKSEAEKMAKDKEQDSPTDFVRRVQKILDEYQPKENPYARFLKKKAKPADTGATSTTAAASDANASAMPLPTLPPKLSDGGTYNFDWRGTPLAQSIYGVAKVAGKGVVVNGDVKGNVYMSLRNVSSDQAMNYLARAFSINWMVDGNNIIVAPDDKMLQSKTFSVKYANTDTVSKEFQSIGIDAKNIYVNKDIGTISVSGTPYQIDQAQQRLEAVDKPIAQCLLLAQMIEVDHGKSLDLGLSYTLPTYSHTGSETGTGESLHGNWIDKLTFSASSTASRELSKGKVIARPMVLAFNGQKGTVDFGDRIPVLTRTDTGSTNTLTVTYQDVGTTLEVTPIINEESGDISLTVKTEISNITGWVTSHDTRAPQMSTRSATTSVHVKSGQSFVIGGLMSQKDLDTLSGIPGLMNLPILGELFKNHTRSKDYAEVYIMLTPFILSDSVNSRDIFDELSHLDKTAKEGDVALPKNDWTKSIGKHKREHVDAKLADGAAY